MGFRPAGWRQHRQGLGSHTPSLTSLSSLCFPFLLEAITLLGDFWNIEYILLKVFISKRELDVFQFSQESPDDFIDLLILQTEMAMVPSMSP